MYLFAMGAIVPVTFLIRCFIFSGNQLISKSVVNNTTVYVQLDIVFLDKKLHVSASSGHHQVLSYDSLRIILYNSSGGVFDEEIS